MPITLHTWNKFQESEDHFDFITKIQQHPFHDFIREEFPYPVEDNKVVVEVGSSAGGCLRERHDDLVSIDPLMKKPYSDYGLITIGVKAIGESLPLQSNSVDYVYCVDVLNHAMDEFEIIEEIHRVLKPNGILFFYTNWEVDDGCLHHKIDINTLYNFILERFTSRDLRHYNNEIVAAQCLIGTVTKKEMNEI